MDKKGRPDMDKRGKVQGKTHPARRALNWLDKAGAAERLLSEAIEIAPTDNVRSQLTGVREALWSLIEPKRGRRRR